MSLSLIIPVYNEIDQLNYTINKLIKLKKKIKNIEFIFIDDFSNDGSYEHIKKLSKKKIFIKLIKNKKKGLGSAIQEGIKKSKLDYVCIFMCDMSDDIKDVITYYNLIFKTKSDCILGTRFSKKSKVKNYPLFKLIINRLANNIIRIIFFSKYNDFTNAFKIYKREVLISFLPIVSENFNVFLELPLKIITRKYSYKIIPINWTDRTHGESKFRIKEVGSKYIFTLLYCLFEKILLNKEK
jgi:dolichol-phosphate mannosyltransferase